MPRFVGFHDAVVDRIELRGDGRARVIFTELHVYDSDDGHTARACVVHAATIALSGVQDARLLGEFETDWFVMTGTLADADGARRDSVDSLTRGAGVTSCTLSFSGGATFTARCTRAELTLDAGHPCDRG